jgi:hypothetical protein
MCIGNYRCSICGSTVPSVQTCAEPSFSRRKETRVKSETEIYILKHGRLFSKIAMLTGRVQTR